MKRIILLLAAIAYLPAYSQTKLVKYELVKQYSKENLDEHWKKKNIPQRIAPVSQGVDVYQMIYYTQWHDGTPIKASGFYFVPHVTDEVPVLCYHHGTRIERDSVFRAGGEETLCMMFAASGYAVLMPDYVGLGLGEKFHLYHHVETEAMSTIDMLRAAKELNPKINASWGQELFLTGYSQGGHATMATHKVMQEKFPEEFKVTASAPMSGAYDLTGAQSEAMFRKYSHPGYLPYLVIGMNEVYKIYDDAAYVFKSPYDSILPPLYNGKHSMGDINRLLPPVPKDVLNDEVVMLFKNDPRHRFTQALVENSTVDWKPESPMLICYCKEDEQVYYKNSLIAHSQMKENGAESVKLKMAGKKFTHNSCAPYTTIYSKMYFDSFLKGSEKGRKGPMAKRLLISLSKVKTKNSGKDKDKKN